MGMGASVGVKAAIGKSSDKDLKEALAKLTEEERQRLIAAAGGGAAPKPSAEAAKYAEAMVAQWDKTLADPQKLVDTALSKRSPFKFERANSMGTIDLNVGVCTVALPDPCTVFGEKYLKMIDSIQDLFERYIAVGSKRQTTPHMSIGAIVLDKKTPADYNEEMERRAGLIPSVKKYLDGLSDPPRAKIQTLKINPDGCVTFQLEHDPAQDVVMTEAQFDEALKKVPTCQTEEAAAGEKRKFKKNEDGTFTVSRFQQVRLELGALGSEIKGMWPSGHMVVVNLVDPEDMKKMTREQLEELFAKCYDAWSPMRNDWFELKNIICLCYVERSLNEGSVVVAPAAGEQPKAFPESSQTAQALLGGIFKATDAGDVLIDVERFEARRADRGTSTWQAFGGEVRELAENKTGVSDLSKMKPREELIAAFKVFDEDANGSIDAKELGKVMSSLGEDLTEEQLQTMIKSADKDGTGRIDYEEFVSVMIGKQ